MDILSQHDVLFTATTTQVYHIYRVIKAISVAGKDASITISEQGLKISVENSAKSCQAHLFLNKSLFSLYKFKPEMADNGKNEETEVNEDSIANFNIPLTALTGCLQIFADVPEKKNNSNSNKNKNSNADDYSSNSQKKEEITTNQCLFIYRGKGYPFMIYLSQGSNSSITTKCELETFENDNDSDDELDTIIIDPNTIVQKVILEGTVMLEALKELDAIDTNMVTIRASAKVAPYFTFISHGELGTSEYSFPNERSILEVFLVTPPGRIYDDLESIINDQDDGNLIVQNSYLFPTFNLIRETVILAQRVNIRCDSSGIMSIQSLCQTETGCQSYIDFRFLPSEY